MTKDLAKTLTTALVQWIDKKRPEGTMCCSSYECEQIEKAFEGGTYDEVENLIKKKLEIPLTPFQQCLNGILRKVFFAEVSDPTSFIIKCIQDNTKELLALAREQFIKDRYVIEKKAFHDAVKKVDPEVMKEVSDNVDKEKEGLTELEQCLLDYANERDEYEYDPTNVAELNEKIIDLIKFYANVLRTIAKKEILKDLPRWKIWENGACGNSDNNPIAIVKRGLNYKLVSTLGIQGEQYIMLSDLEKLPGFKEEEI